MIKYYKITIFQIIVILFFPLIYLDWPQIFLFDYPNIYHDHYDRSFFDIANNFFIPGETSQFHERALFPVIASILGVGKSFDTFELYRFLTYLLWAFYLTILINEKHEESEFYPNYTLLFFIFSLPLTYFMFRQGHTKSDTTIILAVTLIAFSNHYSFRRHLGITILTLSHSYFAFMVIVSIFFFELCLYKDRAYFKSIIKQLITFSLSYFVLTFMLFALGKGLKIPFFGPDENNTLIQTLVWKDGLIGEEFYRLDYFLTYYQWILFIAVFLIIFFKNKILFIGIFLPFVFIMTVNLLFTWNEPRTFGICFFPIFIYGINYIYTSGNLTLRYTRYFDYFFMFITFVTIFFANKGFIF